jgi:hypothetical protein
MRREKCAHGLGVEGLLDGGERGSEYLRPRLRQALRVARTSRCVWWKTRIGGHLWIFCR